MQFLRKATLVACASLLVVSFLWFGFFLSLYQTIGKPDPIKQALRGSGIYQSAITDVLSQAQKEQKPGEASEVNIPVNDPQVRAIITSSFPPSYLQSQVEPIIDSAYAWLSGKTQKLEFKIDLADAKQRLGDGVQQYAQNRFSTLPICPANAIPADMDPLTASCVPPHFDGVAAAAQARQKLVEGEFLKETTLSADTIKSGDGKTLQQQLQRVPVAYQRVVQSMYGMGVLAVLLGAAILFLSATRRNGIRKIAITAITMGSVSALLGWLSSVVLHRAAIQLTNSTNSGEAATQPLQQKAISILEALMGGFKNWWIGYGLTLVASGIIALIVLRVTLHKADEGPGIPVEHPDESLPNKPSAQTLEHPHKQKGSPEKPAV